MQPKVSLCLIVKNEEANLRDCLSPLCSLVSEIVVVDTGSTDRTKEIAAELGARVFDFPWCDDFSAARNEMLRQATGDWILWFDADDRLDRANLASLANLLDSLRDSPAVYLMEVACLKRYESDEPTIITQPRLFKNLPGVGWTGRVHEQVLPSLQRLDVPLQKTEIRIDHWGYRDPALLRKKINRDLRLLKLDFVTNPDDPIVLYNLGMTYMRLGQPREALGYLLSGQQKSAAMTGDWKRSLYAAIAEALQTQNRREEALSLLAQGLEEFPGDPELTYRRAELLCQLNDLGGAERCLLQLIQSPTRDYLKFGVREGTASREARRLLAMIYRDQNRMREAEMVLQTAIAQHPEYVQGWVTLGQLYIGLGQFQLAEHVLRQIEKCPNGDIYADAVRAEMQLAKGNWDAAQQLIESLIAKMPQFVWARVLRANLLRKQGAAVDDCVAAYRDILRVDPGNVGAQEAIVALQSGATRSAPAVAPALSWTITVSE